MAPTLTFQPFYGGAAAGPFVQYRGPPAKNYLRYSILGVYPAFYEETPRLNATLQVAAAADLPSPLSISEATLLDTVCGYRFWRFVVDVAQHATLDGTVAYSLPNLPPGAFRVPSISASWRYAFFSCNGYSSSIAAERLERYKNFSPLWNDMLQECKSELGLHLQIGGGDQLYFDSVWSRVPGLSEWAAMPNKDARKNAEFVNEESVTAYYLDTYLVGFTGFGMREALASIPACMSWDDHDIFDGWGSYPEYLQQSKTFQGIFRCARRMYLLFQQHSNELLAPGDGFFGGCGGLSRVLQCGNSLALVLPDTRSERTLTQVASPPTWSKTFELIAKLLPDTRQLLVVAPVPMVYPHSSSTSLVKALSSGFLTASGMLGSIQSLVKGGKGAAPGERNAVQSLGVYKTAVNQFGEPELLDDLQDHWTVPEHREEREGIIKRLQVVAEQQKLRVTLISGDVHIAAAGALYSHDASLSSTLASSTKALAGSRNMGFLKSAAFADPRLMFQIVSSAICNLPPPPVVANNLASSTREMRFDNSTCERMIDLFDRAADGTALPTAEFYLRRRNWALGAMHKTGMDIFICAEKEKGGLDGATTRYKVAVDDVQH